MRRLLKGFVAANLPTKHRISPVSDVIEAFRGLLFSPFNGMPIGTQTMETRAKTSP
jgi:hypothetical protein